MDELFDIERLRKNWPSAENAQRVFVHPRFEAVEAKREPLDDIPAVIVELRALLVGRHPEYKVPLEALLATLEEGVNAKVRGETCDEAALYEAIATLEDLLEAIAKTPRPSRSAGR